MSMYVRTLALVALSLATTSCASLGNFGDYKRSEPWCPESALSEPKRENELAPDETGADYRTEYKTLVGEYRVLLVKWDTLKECWERVATPR